MRVPVTTASQPLFVLPGDNDGSEYYSLAHIEQHEKKTLAEETLQFIHQRMRTMSGSDKPLCGGCALNVVEAVEELLLDEMGFDDELRQRSFASKLQRAEIQAQMSPLIGLLGPLLAGRMMELQRG